MTFVSIDHVRENHKPTPSNSRSIMIQGQWNDDSLGLFCQESRKLTEKNSEWEQKGLGIMRRWGAQKACNGPDNCTTQVCAQTRPQRHHLILLFELYIIIWKVIYLLLMKLLMSTMVPFAYLSVRDKCGVTLVLSSRLRIAQNRAVFQTEELNMKFFYICIQYHFLVFHFRYISCCRLKIWRRKADDLQHVLCTWCCSCLHCYRKGTTLDNVKWYFHSSLTLNKHYLHESVVGWNLITKYKSIFQCKKYYNAKWWHSALVQVKAFLHRSSMFSGQTVLFEGSFIISLYHNKRQIALFSNPFI